MTQSSTPNSSEPQCRTDVEVEALKRQWRQDPCWDLDSTAGFESHRDELAAYEAAYWTEARQAMEHAQPAYWLKELVTEVRTLNAHLANIDTRLYALAQAAWNRV
jgi:hypothetical protein